MKCTGIVRRMDDLGRIVIPKELRTESNVNAGDAFELFVDKDPNGNVMYIFKRKPLDCVNDVTSAIEAMSHSGDFDYKDHAELQKKLLKVISDYKKSHKN